MSELDKLEQYLDANGFKFKRNDEQEIKAANGLIVHLDKHQIVVYGKNGERLWDAICQRGSYGFEKGLLEIMGTIVTPGKDVEGYLTAQDVIDRMGARA